MATTTIQTAEYALKEYFKGPIRVQFNEEVSPVFKAIQRRAESNPDEFTFPLEYGRHGGVGAFGSDGTLPEAASRLGKRAKSKVVNIAAVIEINDKLLKTSKHDVRAFSDELTRQIQTVTKDGKDMITRNFNGDHFGTFGVVASATGSTVTLDLTDTGTFIEAIYAGQIIDIGTVSGGVFTATTTSTRIVDVDRITGKITLDASATASAGDIVVLHGDFGLEMYGLKDILSVDNVIYDVDRATNKWYNPQYYNRGGGGVQALDPIWIGQAIDDARIRAGANTDFIAVSPGVFRAYEQQQAEYGRNLDMKKIDGGVELATYRSVPISVEPYFMKNSIGTIDTGTLGLHQLANWEWLDEDGHMLKLKDNKAIWWAAMVLYGNIACYKGAANGLITGIEEVN